MSTQDQVSLYLFKQNLKFSAAHFLIFDSHHAERLHGHNYRVKVNLHFPAQYDYSQNGLTIDFATLKKIITQELSQWDEMVLIPEKHPDMKFQVKGNSLHVHFRDRYYVFPKNEVVLLPITNTSVENLSQLLARSLGSKIPSNQWQSLVVFVEETQGQCASTRWINQK